MYFSASDRYSAGSVAGVPSFAKVRSMPIPSMSLKRILSSPRSPVIFSPSTVTVTVLSSLVHLTLWDSPSIVMTALPPSWRSMPKPSSSSPVRATPIISPTTGMYLPTIGSACFAAAVLADVPAFPQPVKQSPKPIAAARTGTENLLPIRPNIFFITEPPSFSNTVTTR